MRRDLRLLPWRADLNPSDSGGQRSSPIPSHAVYRDQPGPNQRATGATASPCAGSLRIILRRRLVHVQGRQRVRNSSLASGAPRGISGCCLGRVAQGRRTSDVKSQINSGVRSSNQKTQQKCGRRGDWGRFYSFWFPGGKSRRYTCFT